jgi:putative tryptophan/tyrosine transport system substrate-binding protein
VWRGALVGITISAAIVASSFIAEPQSASKTPRIGVLAGGAPSIYVARFDAFRQGLRELGYVAGQNIAIEYRYADGKLLQLSALALELVQLPVDVIVAVAAPETAAARRATTTIPIVFVVHGDPVGTGDVRSLSSPGGNVTGMSQMLPQMSAKRLEVLKEAFPRVAHLAVLWNTSNPAKKLDWQEVQNAAGRLGLAVHSREVRGPADFAAAFDAMRKVRPDALMTLDDPVTFTHRASIVEFAAKERLPAIYGLSDFVEAGGLMAYGPNRDEMYRRAASCVVKILKGARPGELPIEQPTTFELVINRKTARTLGVKIPDSLLVRADRLMD